MPAYIGSIITILLDLVTVLHIVRSGADRIWIYIVLIFPVVGCVAYFVAEILPDLWSGRDAVVARDRLHTWVDPNRHYRRLSEDAQITDAVGAKAALAGECFRQGRYAEAEAHYRAALTGLHAEDPALLLGLADTLMAARRFNEVPELVVRIEISDRNYHVPRRTLMLARAAEAAGDVAAAEKAYKELMLKSPSMEVKYHYAHFLYQQGRDAESRSLLEASLVEGRRLPTHARKLNKEWLDRMSEALRGF